MTYTMEYEINSQGSILENLIDRYIQNGIVLLDMDASISKVVLVGSGSSYHSALLGKYFFNNIAHIEASAEYASEYANLNFKGANKNTLYIFISQSGKSYDTLYALRKIKQNGGKVSSLTNNPDSPMHQEVEYGFLMEASEEFAIGATKTFSASVLMLWIMACSLAQKKCIDISDAISNIYQLRECIEYTMNNTKTLNDVADFISKQNAVSILGYGMYYPLALEAALKIKETSYINTSAYPMGEFVHGHFAILNQNNVILNFLGESQKEKELLEKISSKYEVENLFISGHLDNSEKSIKIPNTKSTIINIFEMIVVIQLLAFKIAVALGRDVDKPKGLDKVVEEKEN